MATNLTFKYHREADILRIDKRVPCAQQESEELGDEVIARLNPHTGKDKSPRFELPNTL
jgi:hypothetical protein